jgi:hypothetical protein
MTTGVDPALAERLAAINASTQERATEIGDRVRAKAREIAEESERMREAAAQHCRDLDRQVEERKEDAKNQWARAQERDTTMRFGGEEDEPAPTPPPQPAPRAAVPPPPVAEPRRGRHARREVEDDDDFSTTNWLD